MYKFERLRLFAIFRRLNAKGIKEEFETTRYIYDFDAFEIRRSYHVGKKIFYNILVISVSWFLKLLLPTVDNESIRTLAFAIFHELKETCLMYEGNFQDYEYDSPIVLQTHLINRLKKYSLTC